MTDQPSTPTDTDRLHTLQEINLTRESSLHALMIQMWKLLHDDHEYLIKRLADTEIENKRVSDTLWQMLEAMAQENGDV